MVSERSLDNYTSEALAKEIVRRIKAGSDLKRYSIIGGRNITFYGRPEEGFWRKGTKEGSQRDIKLRSTVSDRDLMKHLQDRILKGDQHAFNEYAFALNEGRVAQINFIKK